MNKAYETKDSKQFTHGLEVLRPFFHQTLEYKIRNRAGTSSLVIDGEACYKLSFSLAMEPDKTETTINEFIKIYKDKPRELSDISEIISSFTDDSDKKKYLPLAQQAARRAIQLSDDCFGHYALSKAYLQGENYRLAENEILMAQSLCDESMQQSISDVLLRIRAFGQ